MVDDGRTAKIVKSCSPSGKDPSLHLRNWFSDRNPAGDTMHTRALSVASVTQPPGSNSEGK